MTLKCSPSFIIFVFDTRCLKFCINRARQFFKFRFFGGGEKRNKVKTYCLSNMEHCMTVSKRYFHKDPEIGKKILKYVNQNKIYAVLKFEFSAI